jgi:hypothetical protein
MDTSTRLFFADIASGNKMLVYPITHCSNTTEISVQRVRAWGLYKQIITTKGRTVNFQKVTSSASIQ